MAADLQRLAGGERRNVRDVVDGLGLREEPRAGRPRVVAVMIATVDGRAAVQGRSVALGHPADRALLRELRTGADALLVGTATLAAERYATLLDADQRERRARLGLPEHPLVATVSRALTLPVAQAPLFAEAGTPIVAFTESEAAAPSVGADLEVVRFAPGGLTFDAVLTALARRGVRGVVCEGGPSLLRELVAQDGVDDLLLTVSPLLVAGDAPTLLAGDALPEAARLVLHDVHRADDHLFLHYRARRA